ncbi:MAG: DNA lyase [Candidatus Hydrothermota bacterium]|nr:MAG: DNA lyase [Candidatus Hydrothermae bacterium]
MENEHLRKLLKVYENIRKTIVKRLDEFREIGKNASEEQLFAELAFCLLTPQSKARICLAAVERLQANGALYHGDYDAILSELKGVRFKARKAAYILKARALFTKNGEFSIRSVLEKFDDPFQMREWLVMNIKGMGYKEASHFLRNIGMGSQLAILADEGARGSAYAARSQLAILDRHILKNLKLLGVIHEVPKSLTRPRYLEIETKMANFADEIGIPLDHLDLLLWYNETGEVLK